MTTTIGSPPPVSAPKKQAGKTLPDKVMLPVGRHGGAGQVKFGSLEQHDTVHTSDEVRTDKSEKARESDANTTTTLLDSLAEKFNKLIEMLKDKFEVWLKKLGEWVDQWTEKLSSKEKPQAQETVSTSEHEPHGEKDKAK